MIARLWRSIGNARPYLSLRTFEVSTSEGRARERQRRALLSTIVAVAAKAVSVGTQLITIPLTLNYLGTERFGLWMTMSSVITMLAFADFGIGNGLVNAVSTANGRDDGEAVRCAVSSAAFVLALIATAVLVALLLSYEFVPWATFFNVHTPLAVSEAGPAAAAFTVCFALNIPASVVQRVQLGLQMGFVANLWQAVGSLFGLIAVLAVVHAHAGLYSLVVALAGAPVIAATINGTIFFVRTRPELMPRISLVSSDAAISIARVGLLFFVLQVVVAVTYASDTIVIARILGAKAVTIYALPDKMFSLIPTIMSMILMPLWPAYSEAIARRDIEWTRSILKTSLAISAALSITLSLSFLLFGSKLLSLWTGRVINAPLALLAGMACWKVIEAVGNALAVYLNGSNVIREQVLIAITTAAFAITAKIYLVRDFGVSGAIWATVAAYLVIAAVPLCILVRRHSIR